MARWFMVFPVIALIITGAGCAKKVSPTPSAIQKTITTQATKSMTITSSAFGSNQSIPAVFTCDGESHSIPLTIAHVSSKAKSLALMMVDPDAPKADGYLHWLMWNIDPSTALITENAPPTHAVFGKNDANTTSYVGPCPPSGTHHYHLHVFALDTNLTIARGSTRQAFLTAINGHVIDHAELVGTYAKKK